MVRILLDLLRKLSRWIRLRSPLARYFYDLDNAAEFDDAACHEEMLADRARVDAYAAALDRHVKPGDTVVDIGTGTGILAFLAARNAARVYAVEHGPVIETARRVAEANGIANVEFVRANSRDFTPPERVDAIVHEQIGGDNPFSENMIENLLDARRRMLKPGGRILPNRFEIFLEPVELKAGRQMPLLWEFRLHGVDYGVLRPDEKERPGNGQPLNRRLSVPIRPDDFGRFVCSPHPLLTLDLETLEAAQLPRTLTYEGTATGDARIDGLYLYFRAGFDEEIAIDTAPTNPPTNWAQRLLRVEQKQARQGDAVRYELTIGSYLHEETWRLQWRTPRG